ncbi:PE family protein [Mycobacterium uberis]|uniref:PE family protein n=1 Tax=Mycobacterium uberis TaxID=2162698 RepID=UPI000E303A0F|nr:PE family protein [Mycobacterium uberis]
MSSVIAAPEVFAATSTDLAGFGPTLTAANEVALAATTSVLTAGADEVSITIADLFRQHS